jgi:hypothetical protein
MTNVPRAHCGGFFATLAFSSVFRRNTVDDFQATAMAGPARDAADLRR